MIWDCEAKTTKVKVTLDIEVDVAGWAIQYGVEPAIDETMITAVKRDVKDYFETMSLEMLGCNGVAKSSAE
tara:strand:- start:108 stop:320 length:213 start_codon:yes stop_codon:yes gene_type:complete